MMSRIAASIVMALAAALASHALAQPHPGAQGPARVYSVNSGSKSGVLLGVEGLVVSAIDPNVRAEITLQAGTGLPQPFYDWVSAALVGRQVALAARLDAVDPGGGKGETILLSNPRLTGVGFGAFDKASRGATHMDVLLQAAARATPAGSPKLPEVAAQAVAARWLADGYRLTLGKLDASQVTHIDAFTMTPGTGAQFEITVSPATAPAFERIAPTPRKRAAVPIGDGQLELTGADGTVIATLALRGVQITGLRYGPPPAAGAPRPALVGIMAKLVDLRFTPAMAR